MKLYKSYIKKGSLFCLFFILLLFTTCSGGGEWKKLQGEALGTTYHITFYSGEDARQINESHIDSIMEWINHSLSTYTENSLISAYNANSNKLWDDTSQLKYFFSDVQHLIAMLNLSAIISEETGGAFDPSAGALFDLWDKAKIASEIPDTALIKAILVRTGMKKLKSDPNGLPVYRDSLLQLNFNAIAKGYAVDVVAGFLEHSGIEKYMVEIGGEIRCKGLNSEGKPWSIGINRPMIGSDLTDIFHVLKLSDESIATSGNYRNYFMIGDSILGHTIDPRTGYPVINNLKSATVFHQECAVADAFATACMVLGLDSSVQLISADTSLKAYFIYEQEGQLQGKFVE